MKKFSNSKVLFGSFNTILFCCGFTKIVFGFLLLSDSKRLLLSWLLVAPEGSLENPPFYYLALALLAAGLTVCAVSVVGVWATYIPSYTILTIYFVLVVCLLSCECAGGAAAATWPRCMGGGGWAGVAGSPGVPRGGAVAALQGHYAVPDYEHYTVAVDLAQTALLCCGMTGAHDYALSVWQTRRLGPRGLSAPPSCCVQRAASHLDPTPSDAKRCQEQPDNEYRHSALTYTWDMYSLSSVTCPTPGKQPVASSERGAVSNRVGNFTESWQGCLAKIEDWYQRQYVVFMLALFSVAIFKLALLLSTVYSCISLRKTRLDRHTFMIKPTNHHENIYERNLSGIHEPITAKYIQPNNYYSPRVRNPRIFHNKPNEFV